MAIIVCPSCTLAVPIDDVDLRTKLAKCRRCESVFDFQAQVRTPQEVARRRRELVPPRGFWQVQGPDRAPLERAGYRDAGDARTPAVEVRHMWRSGLTVPMLLGTLMAGAWTSAMVTALVGSRHATTGGLVVALLFALPGLLAVSAFVIGLVNHTRFVIDDAHVVVRHGPFPWFGARSTPSASIRALHVAARRPLGGGERVVYDVLADTPSDPKHEIARRLPNAEAARFVARVIAERLSLPDPD